MKCAVRTCDNTSNNRPDLRFFKLPNEDSLKDEWLDALGIEEHRHILDLAVCELHFNIRDFRAGKKELKPHAVPVVYSGSHVSDTSIDTDDDLICIHSCCDPDITEVQADVLHNDMLQEVKRESLDVEVKQEPAMDLEADTYRRPSRRAARVAAKKISNHVRSYGVNDDDPSDISATHSIGPRTVSSSHPYSRPKQKKVQIGLQMECYDEFLSPIQAEFLLKAQVHYNTTMKSIRQLMSTSVKVFQAEPDGSIVPLTYAPDISLKTGFVSTNAKSPTVVRNRPNRSNPATAVSMKISHTPSQVASIFIT
ncbi:uncharacterized protein NPIL_573811 [Nephila pilipes]|uniref:THAP-type domain-containing protein n=1 Tax=Nephila pilipes TaxID=299642 RepID=A0A8X6U2A3_NEPPI|nr:uncharacterized protein NPIL_573811 [Nephila pilipes]